MMQRSLDLPPSNGERKGGEVPSDSQLLTTPVTDVKGLEEEFICGVCYELLILPTTLTCGHSFCRHCLAHWFDVGKKAECPTCRTKFTGLPMENIQIKSSLMKLFGDRYTKRKLDVFDDKDNKQAIEKFDEILKKRRDDTELTATSMGCLIGSGLVLALVACLYLAVHWGSSEYDLLVKKPLVRWSVNDVSDWLDDLGLDSYQATFAEQRVNGRMLSEITPDDLTSMFVMTNPLHQRMFLQALNYTKTHGVKQPTNLWEYKAIYNGYTTFLICIMGHTPRIGLFYLYQYDEDSYQFYKQTTLNCNVSDSEDTAYSFNTWLFYAGSVIAPHFVKAKFVYCFSDFHYWTSRFIIMQCICKGLMEFVSLYSILKTGGWKPLNDFIIDPLGSVTVYYVASCVWWLVPTILRDAFFYAEVYFIPLISLKDIITSVFFS